MTEVTFTFRLDAALKADFAAMADDQDLSAAQVLRRMMRDAVEDHREAAAHDRWQRREIDDAMHEADGTRSSNPSHDTVADDWRARKDAVARDDA
ncbi:hypothetical protein [Sphingomonas adhaesiva]|uniref:hypothetical protein n=1 Tax=Sphingomonas adhaesiva TaxID=28212 RepID=UPI002FF5D6F6